MPRRTRVIGTDPLNRAVTLWHDNHDGTVAVENRQDVTSVIEANKARFAEVDERAPYNHDMNRIARIPMLVMHKLRKDGIIDANGKVRDRKRFLRWLQDRDNLHFRTRPGRLI